MKKIIKHYPMTDGLIFRPGYDFADKREITLFGRFSKITC
jgi:hypothetical protein